MKSQNRYRLSAMVLFGKRDEYFSPRFYRLFLPSESHAPKGPCTHIRPKFVSSPICRSIQNYEIIVFQHESDSSPFRVFEKLLLAIGFSVRHRIGHV